MRSDVGDETSSHYGHGVAKNSKALRAGAHSLNLHGPFLLEALEVSAGLALPQLCRHHPLSRPDSFNSTTSTLD